MKLLYLIFILAGWSVSAQQASVLAEVFHDDANKSALFFPVVTTQNPEVSQAINDTLQARIIGGNITGKSLVEKLENLSRNGMVWIDFDIAFNRNDLLSLHVFVEGCGAYCEGHYEYFNFDLKDGKSLAVVDLIEPSKWPAFEKMMTDDIRTSLMEYRDTLKGSEEDPETIAFAVEEMRYCIDHIRFERFALSWRGVEVDSVCPFAHAIKSIGPRNLYPLSDEVKTQYFKKEFLERIQKR